MKSFLKIILILLLPTFLHAQQETVDSLKLAFQNTANDTIRMEIYLSLSEFYQNKEYDSSFLYANNALQHARTLNQKITEASALNKKGIALLSFGNYPQSLESFIQALQIGEDPLSDKNHRYPAKAREYRLLTLGFTHLYLGDLYGETGNIHKQVGSYLELIKLAVSIHDTILEGDGCMQLGAVYIKLNKLDSALLLEQKALVLFSNSNTYWEGLLNNYIGEIYFRKGKIDLSKKAFLKSAQISEEQNNGFSLGPNYISLGNFYRSQKKPDSSLLFARKAMQAFKRLRDPSGMASSYSLLASIYNDQNIRDSSFLYLKLATVLKDSLHTLKINKMNEFQNIGFDEQIRLKELEQKKIETQTKIRTYSLLAGIVVFMVIAFLLYRNNRNRKRANDLLQKQKEEIELQKRNVELALIDLKSTQSQLIQSEKMASLGELTAGIAHEIQNPLNFVNNFSEVSTGLVKEMVDEVEKGNTEEVKSIAKDVVANLEKINHHGNRAADIVKGMLQHSRSSSGVKEPTNINALADEYLRLAYHGLRAKDKSFNAIMKTDFDESIANINIIPQDIGRVILNLITNAFYVVNEKSKQNIVGYEPTVSISTHRSLSSGEGRGEVLISVKDNGSGIPQKILDKIFQPFFTTKPTGQGTGLGLSLSYDIVKAHGGTMEVQSTSGVGSEFIINLPFKTIE